MKGAQPPRNPPGRPFNYLWGSNSFLLETCFEPHLDPATRIERATCGLRFSESPTAENVTPQETTSEATPEVGPDRTGLPCPGSSVVAETHADEAGFENPRVPKTIGRDLEQLHRAQSLVEESDESRQESRSVTESYTVRHDQ